MAVVLTNGVPTAAFEFFQTNLRMEGGMFLPEITAEPDVALALPLIEPPVEGEDWQSALRIGKHVDDADIVAILSRPADDTAAVVDKFSELLACLHRKHIDPMDSNDVFFSLLELAAVHDGAIYAMLSIHFNLCMGSIGCLGNQSPYLKQLYARMHSGRAIGVFLATEVGFGNNLVGLETRATYEPERECFVLRSPSPVAHKFMPNTLPGPLPKIAVVLARLYVGTRCYGIFPFAFQLTDPFAPKKGVNISSLGKKAGFLLDNAITSFSGIEIPYDSLLGGGMISLARDGTVVMHERKRMNLFLNAMRSVNIGKLCMSVGSIAMSKASLYITHRYGQQRTVFGASGSMPIGEYSLFKDAQILDAASVVVFSLWARALQSRLPKSLNMTSKMGVLGSDLVDELIAIKALSTWRGQDVLVRCRERCGAQGLFSDNKIIDYFVTNNGTITAEGDNQVMLLKIGQSLIDAPPDLDLPAQPVLNRLLAPLKRYFGIQCERINEILCNVVNEDRFSAWNRCGDDIIRLTQIFGVFAATKAILPRIEAGIRPVSTALEIFLHDWNDKLSGELLLAGAQDVTEQRLLRQRRSELLRLEGEGVLSMLDHFGVSEANVRTPISSGNYIDWYAAQHRHNAIQVAAR